MGCASGRVDLTPSTPPVRSRAVVLHEERGSPHTGAFTPHEERRRRKASER